MFGDKCQNKVMSTQWLFNRRLQFLGPRFHLSEMKNNSKICQKQFTDGLLHRYTKIQSQEEIKQIFQILNSILSSFWCYDEANQKTKGGKSQVNKKKNNKDIQKQNNKVKKFLQTFKIDVSEEQEWRKIIKEKNVTNLLRNLYKIYFYILTQNFELVEKITQSTQNSQTIFEYQLPSIACQKNKQLPAQLKFRICVIAIDIIQIIKTIRFAFMEQDQKQKFDSYLECIKEPCNFASMYKSFKNPNHHIFIQTMRQIQSEQSPEYKLYKLWLNIQDIKERYLIDQATGVLQMKTYKSKLQTTVAKQLELYWLFTASQYINANFEGKDTEVISLYSVFEDYSYFYEHLIEQAAQNQAKIQEILSFLKLVTGPWKELDYGSSLKLLWKCLLELNEKVKLPLQYFTKNQDLIIETCHFKIDSYEQQRNQQIKEQLKNILLSLSRELIQITEDQSFKKDYLQNNKRRVSQILSKFNHYQNAANQMKIQMKEANSSNIITYLNKIQQKLNEKNIRLSILPYKEQQHIMSKFQSIFETDKDTVDEIKFFMAMANGRNLQQCSNFYKKKIENFLKRGHIETESINNMTFGIVSSIRVAIFGLIASIKLQENPQNHQVGKIQDSLKQQRLERLIQKLMRVYHRKNRYLRRENRLSTNQQDYEGEISLPFMKRISSLQINPNEFMIEQQFINNLDIEDQGQNFEDNQFRLKILKIISEIKIEMINKKVLQLEQIERPLRQEYKLIKKRVYEHASKELGFQNTQDLKVLPQIQYQFTRKRFWPAWRKLTIINKENLLQIQKRLQTSWGNQNNILKFYVALLRKYRERQSQSKEFYLKMSGQQCIKIVNFVLQNYKLEGEQRQRLKQDLLQSIKILQNFEYSNLLQIAHKQQMQRIKSMEEAKESHRIKNQYVCFKQIQGKLSIIQITKNDNPISKKYSITPSPKEYENVLKKLQKMTKLNKYISLTKDQRQIHLHVDQHQIEFQSYPKLVKYLMESYYQTVQFCHNNLQFLLYPLVRGKHITIGKVKQKENHLTLRFNPYQGIILNILLTFDELKRTKLYNYPQFPFVEFSEQINHLFMNSKQKIYSLQNQTADYHAFVHLIQQMKSISLEQLDGNLEQTFKNILKCPYFWSTTQKFYELVQFKEKYHSNINIEQCRRKQNQKIRSQLKKENDEQYEDLLNYLREPQKKQKHPFFKSMSSYNRTTQIYLSIEGLIQKQAFEEDIGNFRDKNSRGQLIPQKYKYHAYWWIKDKKEIEYLLEIVAERQKKRGSKKSSVYQKTFNSFQNQIRNLRNLAVHYIYDLKKEKQITIQQKIRLFQQNFPKLFVFLYRWKPFVGKDYNTIQSQKIDLLCKLFPNKQNNDVILKLEGIKELEEYNIPNYKINKHQTSTLLQEFGYDRGRANGCYICGLISMLLFKQSSFWGFISDAKYPKEKNGKQVLYNVLFWDHKTVGCNGMQYLERAFYNVSQRNQFTSQELAEIQQSEITLMQQKQRIERKITKLRNQQESSDQQDRQYRQNKESVEVRYHKLSQYEKEQLHQELVLTDYVPKYFVFQLEMKFPYFFQDLRKFRYVWDKRAKEIPISPV